MRRLWVLVAALAAGCGESAVCGNGAVESGEQCDDGNLLDDDACSSVCRAQATIDTFIKFLPLIGAQFPGFFESCNGLDIEDVEIAVVGPRMVTERVPCSFGQLKIASLPSGSYTATLRAFNRAGGALSRGTATKAFTVAGKTQEVVVDWPYEDFTSSYTGTFSFRVFWANADTCAGAAPPVIKQKLRLERNGVALPGMTVGGVGLDGVVAGTCHDASELITQAANGLPWGPARLIVTGVDGAGIALFRGTFDTFVGAAQNPPLDFHVPSLAPDAGVADAGVPDAL